MKVAFRASLVILIHANTSTDTPFANMPAITDPCHLLEAHLPPRVTLEHSAKFHHLGLAAHCSSISLWHETRRGVTRPLTLLSSPRPRRDLLFSSAGHVKPAPAPQFSQMLAYIRSHQDSRAGTETRAEMPRGACRPPPLTGR